MRREMSIQTLREDRDLKITSGKKGRRCGDSTSRFRRRMRDTSGWGRARDETRAQRVLTLFESARLWSEPGWRTSTEFYAYRELAPFAWRVNIRSLVGAQRFSRVLEEARFYACSCFDRTEMRDGNKCAVWRMYVYRFAARNWLQQSRRFRDLSQDAIQVLIFRERDLWNLLTKLKSLLKCATSNGIMMLETRNHANVSFSLNLSKSINSFIFYYSCTR